MSMEGGATPMEQFAAAVCLTYEKNKVRSIDFLGSAV